MNHAHQDKSGLQGFNVTRAVAISRRAVVAASCLWLLLLLLFEPALWRLAIVAIVLCAFVGGMVLDKRFPEIGNKLNRTPALMLYLGQGALLFATGGIESPLIVLVPATTMFMGFAAGRWNALPIVLGLKVLYVTAFAGLRLAGIDLLPEFLTLAPGRFNDSWVMLLTLFICFGMVGGSVTGTFVRIHLERIHQRALGWEGEALHVAQERSMDLMRMSSSLAHELKNPLAAIQGLSTLMASQTPEGSRDDKRFQVLTSEVERMSSTLEGFLTLARPLPDISLTSVPVQDMLHDIALLHEGIAQERSVALKVEPSDLDITCDPQKTRQILINLIQNALDASSPEEQIVLSAHPSGANMVVLRVEDEGPGPDMSLSLFSPGITTKSEGSGLGLAIARIMAEQHGGTVTLEAKPNGRGCRAEVTLPQP